MDIKQFINLIEIYAPSYLIEDFDNGKTGFILNLLKYRENIITKIGVCLDITLNILSQAKEDNVDLLICHHNPFFDMKYRIEHDLVDSLKILFEKNISIYCIHTNYDNAKDGMNYAFVKLLELEHILYIDGLYIGEINYCTTKQFITFLSKKLCGVHISYIGSKLVNKILVCCGSGFSSKNLEIAKKYNVDTFISSEWKHSNIIRKREDVTLINISHYDMENIGMQYLANKMRNKYSELNVIFYNDPIKLEII